MTEWIKVSDRLPQQTEAGAFGAVEVIVQCDSVLRGEAAQVLRLARFIHIGKNKDRILWVTMEDKTSTPIENAAWFVTHWRPFPKFPEAI